MAAHAWKDVYKRQPESLGVKLANDGLIEIVYQCRKQKETTPKALSRENFEKLRDLEIPEKRRSHVIDVYKRQVVTLHLPRMSRHRNKRSSANGLSR